MLRDSDTMNPISQSIMLAGFFTAVPDSTASKRVISDAAPVTNVGGYANGSLSSSQPDKSSTPHIIIYRNFFISFYVLGLEYHTDTGTYFMIFGIYCVVPRRDQEFVETQNTT